jgi:hypothetical protein
MDPTDRQACRAIEASSKSFLNIFMKILSFNEKEYLIVPLRNTVSLAFIRRAEAPEHVKDMVLCFCDLRF